MRQNLQEFVKVCFQHAFFLLRAFFRIMFPAAFDLLVFPKGSMGKSGVWAPGKVGIELASEGQGKVKGVTTAWQGQGGWMDGFPICMVFSWCYVLGASCLVNLLLLRNPYERKWSLGRTGGFTHHHWLENRIRTTKEQLVDPCHLQVTYFKYEVHVSKGFLIAPSFSSAMYLANKRGTIFLILPVLQARMQTMNR